eukprot:m.35211 g.35211  ORF g.35211 m.35211 type:complete len:50 (-) comp17101_c1_seq1:53-202(-)
MNMSPFDFVAKMSERKEIWEHTIIIIQTFQQSTTSRLLDGLLVKELFVK